MNQPKDNEVKDSLRANRQDVDQQIDAPEPTHRQAGASDSHGRRYAIVATAAATIVVGGVLALSVLDRADVTTAGSADTAVSTPDTTTTSIDQSTVSAEPPAPVGIEPAPDAATFPGVAACADWFAGRPAEIINLGPPSFDPRTEVDGVVVLALPATASSVQVILAGHDGYFSCQTNRSDGALSGTGSFSAGPGDISPPVFADKIALVSQGWSSETGTTGPGSIETIGRIGSDVAAVWVTLGDDTALPGLIADDGWFTLDGPIPDGVPLFAETYHWRLTDGTITSAPGDSLRPKTLNQQCASTPGCIEERLAELQAEAEAAGLDAQALALADGQISPEERQAAMMADFDCLIEAGIDADLSPNGDGIRIDHGPGTPENSQELRADCGRQHHDLVAELADLRDAEEDPSDD